MKKLKIFFILIFSLSQLCFAGIFGGGGSSGIGKLVGIVSKIADQQLKMQLEQVQQGLQLAEQLQNQVQQIQNQMQSLENEALNLKQLGKEVSQGNINSLNDAFDRIISLQNSARSLFYKVEKFDSEFENIYTSSLELGGWLKDDVISGMDKIDDQMKKVREQSRNAVYDAAKSADFSAKINADKRNIETILQNSATAEGALQAIQAGNNLLGSINTTLLDLRDVLSSQIRLASTVQAEVNEVMESDAQKKEETERQYEEEQNRATQDLNTELEELEEIDITKWGK